MFGHRTRDAGDTLVEVLVSIVLLGIAGTAVMGSITMGLQASSVTVGYGANQNVLRGWAEQIEAMPYKLCAQTTDYSNIAVLPVGTTVTITQLRYWDGGAYQVSTPACVPGNDKGLQEITLRANSTAAAQNEPQSVLIVVKRRECVSGC